MYDLHESFLRREEFKNIGIQVPDFDYEALVKRTYDHPIWVHFGGGNLFRAFHSSLQQGLIQQGEADKGIIVIDTYDDEIIDRIFHKNNNLSLNVIMKGNDELEKEVIASVTESHYFSENNRSSWNRVKEIFRNPSLQMVTLTITEKGYNLKDTEGKLSEIVRKDIDAGPAHSRHTMSQLCYLLWERYQNGAYPIAIVSTDNIPRNGQTLKNAVLDIANLWQKKGFVDSDFIDNYLLNRQKVSFPWSMIDRIVPSPSEKVAQQLVESGFGDTEIFVTKKHTVTAPFVNTEEVNYLVIEDHFPNGRPPLEKAGVYFTNRETVDKAERMKVYTCLNPIHTTMAVFGCMLGYNSIADETNDPEIKKLIEKVGFDEGLPVVSDPGIINPVTFLNEFLYKRLPNKNIPDTPQRITTDTSQKIKSIYGQTIQLYKEKAGQLQFIPLSIAGWLRYLMGMDDQGNSITLSPDPMMDYLQKHLQAIHFGDPESVADHLYPVLSNKQIFGVDLYQVHLGRKIEKFVKEMISHKGAVRATLKKYLYDEKEESS